MGLAVQLPQGFNGSDTNPGDIHYSKGNFTFYFPIVTCVLVSLVLTLLLWRFRKQ